MPIKYCISRAIRGEEIILRSSLNSDTTFIKCFLHNRWYKCFDRGPRVSKWSYTFYERNFPYISRKYFTLTVEIDVGKSCNGDYKLQVSPEISNNCCDTIVWFD